MSSVGHEGGKVSGRVLWMRWSAEASWRCLTQRQVGLVGSEWCRAMGRMGPPG